VPRPVLTGRVPCVLSAPMGRRTVATGGTQPAASGRSATRGKGVLSTHPPREGRRRCRHARKISQTHTARRTRASPSPRRGEKKIKNERFPSVPLSTGCAATPRGPVGADKRYSRPPRLISRTMVYPRMVTRGGDGTEAGGSDRLADSSRVRSSPGLCGGFVSGTSSLMCPPRFSLSRGHQSTGTPLPGARILRRNNPADQGLAACCAN